MLLLGQIDAECVCASMCVRPGPTIHKPLLVLEMDGNFNSSLCGEEMFGWLTIYEELGGVKKYGGKSRIFPPSIVGEKERD